MSQIQCIKLCIYLGVAYHGWQHKERVRGDCRHHILVGKLRYTWNSTDRSQNMMQQVSADKTKSKLKYIDRKGHNKQKRDIKLNA